MADSKSMDGAKPEKEKNVSKSDIVSRVIAIIAFIMSAFTFLLQFVAHDAVSYSLSHESTTTWPAYNYFTFSLNIFNSQNLSSALIAATANLIERKLGDQWKVTDADCQIPAGVKPRVLSLFVISQEKAPRCWHQ
jgi:hypothetical protein